jgi:drug/metabolite transporter (DMT)-like permease
MVCVFYAYGRLPAEDVVTLSNTSPIWIALLAWPLYGDAPGAKTVLAILVGVAGMVLVEQPQLVGGNRWAVMAALAAAWFSAVAMLGLNRLRDLDPLAVVVHFSAVATVFCGVTFLLTPRAEPLDRLLEPGVVLRLVGLGITATIGQVFLTLAFGRGAPAKVSVVGLTQIVFVMVMCVWVFDRSTNTEALIGTALVIAPTAWLLTRSRATSGTKPAPALVREEPEQDRDEDRSPRNPPREIPRQAGPEPARIDFTEDRVRHDRQRHDERDLK